MEKKEMGKRIGISFLVLIYLFVLYVVIDANKYKALVHTIEGAGRVGVNPTTESLDFGDISPGMSARRRVNIENKTFMPMQVLVLKSGDIKNLMDVSDQSFKLKSGSSTKVEFTTYIPASAELDKDYNGRVYIFKIPTFGL